MSFSIDVNILVYASDEQSNWQQPARAFLGAAMRGPEIICFAWSTLMSYLRISTHRSILAHPLTVEEAHKNIDSIVTRPQVRLLVETERFWPVYRELAEVLKPRGHAVPDTHLAALLKVYEVDTLYTVDADFRKFDFLKVRNPLKQRTS